MATQQKYRNNVQIGIVSPWRIMFPPSIAQPRKIAERGDAKYEVQIGAPKDHPDVKRLVAECKALASEKWGDDVPADLKFKFIDGDTEYDSILNHPEEKRRRDYPHLKGMVLLKLRAKRPIAAFDIRERSSTGDPVLLTEDNKIAKVFYTGCNVAVTLTLATYDRIDRSSPAGVTMYPEQICYVSAGERLSIGDQKSDGSAFAQVQGQLEAEDPTGGEDLDDEIPF